MKWVKASERLPGIGDRLSRDSDGAIVVRRILGGGLVELLVSEIENIQEDDEWLEYALEGMVRE